MSDVVMPRLSDSMEEGDVLTWLKQVGDEIAVGEELVEIETDKANMAYESDLAGTLTEILAKEGDAADQGADRRGVEDSGAAAQLCGSCRGAVPATTPPAEGPLRSPRPRARSRAPRRPRRPGRGSRPRRWRASATERGVELAGIAGSSPGGRIVKSDVEAAAASRELGAGIPGGELAPPAPSPAGPGPGAVQSAKEARSPTSS
ncbi:MAG: biotin/lipoyl-containing protein [Solirubrobacterales bacterium]